VAPPSRSARAAVLASSVQRSKPTPYPSKARSALIRRAIVVGLVIVALALVTISFRSPTAGALHDAQGVGSTVLRPFQIAATRIAQPFRDAYDYVDGLANARADLKRQKQIDRNLRERDIHIAAQAALLPSVLKLLHFVRGRSFPNDFRAVSTSVTSPPGIGAFRDRPPTRSRASSTTTEWPARRSLRAAVSPAKPAPTTTTSVLLDCAAPSARAAEGTAAAAPAATAPAIRRRREILPAAPSSETVM